MGKAVITIEDAVSEESEIGINMEMDFEPEVITGQPITQAQHAAMKMMVLFQEALEKEKAQEK